MYAVIMAGGRGIEILAPQQRKKTKTLIGHNQRKNDYSGNSRPDKTADSSGEYSGGDRQKTCRRFNETDS